MAMIMVVEGQRGLQVFEMGIRKLEFSFGSRGLGINIVLWCLNQEGEAYALFLHIFIYVRVSMFENFPSY